MYRPIRASVEQIEIIDDRPRRREGAGEVLDAVEIDGILGANRAIPRRGGYHVPPRIPEAGQGFSRGEAQDTITKRAAVAEPAE